MVGYSVPVRRRISLAELRSHLHTLPDQPDLVPYRTSYYAPTWGFCLAQSTLDAMPDGDYEVCIDSTLADGSLTYAEHVVPGQVDDEVIVSCHVCHPSLANDNMAGVAVAVELAKSLENPYYTYRFIFAPGTIGAITWLARNRDRVTKVKHGLVLACAGDRGSLTYKQSRRGDAEIDRVMQHVLRDRPHDIREFSPYGYDERQYCSPGFNLGVGSLTRTPYAGYPEYHTSGDNPDFVDPGVPCGHAGGVPGGGRGPRRQPALRQPEPARRAAAGQTRPVRVARRPQRREGRAARDAVGAEPVRR